MDFSKLMIERRSVRSYKPDPVESEKLSSVLEAARMAPSAANRQPYKLYVIPTKGREQELRKIYNSDWFVQPPYVICICVSESTAWKRQSDGLSFAMVDAAIAFDHLVLTATSLGLGTCWISAFDVDAVRQLLELPEDLVPLLFTPLGYPDSQPHPPKHRRPLEDLVVFC